MAADKNGYFRGVSASQRTAEAQPVAAKDAFEQVRAQKFFH